MVLIQEGSSVKKLAILSVALLLAVFILLPTSSSGKYNSSKPVAGEGSPLADGWLLPPLPSGAYGNTLVADGQPIPPFPPAAYLGMLVADGQPKPPFPPAAYLGILVADGQPKPPFPPAATLIAV